MSVKIATYNTYFDPKFYQERFRYIVQLLAEKKCDVLCLQEIPTKQLSFCEETLIASGYHFNYFASAGEYGILTSSCMPWTTATKKYYSISVMGRSFIDISVTINLDDDKREEIHIINTHLESMWQFQKVRDQQLKEIVNYCENKQITENTVVCGDFNSTYKHIYAMENAGFCPQVDFPTWFACRYAVNSKNPKHKSKFDRIFTGSNVFVDGDDDTDADADAVEAVGTEPILRVGDGTCYPSDHDGLVIMVSVSASTSSKC